MRIWSIHPKYLDAKRLVACWRESLLARKVLEGKTKGYKNHSQLIRFKNHIDPVGAINQYLHYIADEGDKRGYKFNRSKLYPTDHTYKINVNAGQLVFEMKYLQIKLNNRFEVDDSLLKKMVEPNPFFAIIDNNNVEQWERI